MMRDKLVSVMLWLGCAAGVEGRTVYYQNFTPAGDSALAAAARAAGDKLAPLPVNGQLEPGAPVLLLAQTVAYPPNQRDELSELLDRHVSGGGALAVFPTGLNYQMLRLAFMLPTTGFMMADQRMCRGEASVATTAPEFAAARGLAVPWYYEIRPWHVIERGQEKHFIYERPMPYVRYRSPGDTYEYMPPGSWFWSRPLNNRDWQTLAALDDFQAMPLLLTARYGAGRTVAAGTNLAALPVSPEATALWTALLKFLPAASPSAPEHRAASITGSGFDRASRALTLTVNSSGPQTAELVLRLLSFEGTLLADQRREVRLSHGVNRAVFTLPAPTALSPEETRRNDRYLCRVGVLTDSGATLADEQTIPVDAAPPLTLTLASDETRRVTNELFPNTGILNSTLAQRYGFQSDNYAYRPGDIVNLAVTLRNGVRNLAPLARLTDLNNPDNPAVIALTDNGIAFTAHADWYAKNGHPFFAFKTSETARVKCEFPRPVTLESIELMSGAGPAGTYGHRMVPDAVCIYADGAKVYENLDAGETWALAEQGNGKFNCQLAQPVTAREWTLEFPHNPRQNRRGADRNLGEMWLWGWDGAAPATVSGTLTVSAVNAFTGQTTPLATLPLSAAGTARQTLAFSLPDAPRAELYRVDARFEAAGVQAATAALPLLAVRPALPLTKAYTGSDPDPQTVGEGFIVSRGFRAAFPYGTGGQFTGNQGWGNPDDMIWCFAYGFKEDQQHASVDRLASLLFASYDTYGHYTTPWRPFASGEEFYTIAMPHILAAYQKLPNWKNATIAKLYHSDRWDAGPGIQNMNDWSDIAAFDDFLRDHGKLPLKGYLRSELLNDLHTNHEIEWREWHLDRYLATIRLMRDTFAAAGKQFQLSSQGFPIIPVKKGDEVLQYVVGSQNDGTWGMVVESPARTYGRQMGVVALAPDLNFRLLTVIHWVSAVLNNAQWRGTVATVEAGRRRFLGEYFIGRVRTNGVYSSMYDTAYAENGRNSNRTSEQDYQAYLQMLTQGVLLTPSAPIGAGLVTANDFFSEPQNLRFSFFGEDIPEVMNLAYYNGWLRDYGYPVSFCARLDTLEKWAGVAPLLVTNPAVLTAKELAILETCETRGCKIIALNGGGDLPLPVSQWFEQQPATRKIIALAAERNTPAVARAAAAELQKFTRPALGFEPGVSGYGFVSNGRNFVIVEDWLEIAREIKVTVRSAAAQLAAVELTNHRPLTVTKNSDGTFTVTLPLAAGDGALISYEER